MLTRKTAINIVENFVKKVKASGTHVRRAVFFGSRAHGKPHKRSDIDVALIADEFSGVDDVRLFGSINNKKEYSGISTRTYNTREFTPGKDPFVEVIMERGVEISCKTI